MQITYQSFFFEMVDSHSRYWTSLNLFCTNGESIYVEFRGGISSGDFDGDLLCCILSLTKLVGKFLFGDISFEEIEFFLA